MEENSERECSALGGLFHQIVNDMKNGTPLWEDLVVKATKLHTCLRATLNAITAYLDAFQKIADAATNTRGATKEIGTALTRICLRHKAVEAKMRSFTSAIMDCLVVPLQEKIEDWKKTLINLDKEHARDYKRARTELKKRSTDTLRLQKKARKCNKSSDLQRRVECSLQDVSERKQVLEEIEKKAVRSALVEERSRFCLLVAFLKPVVNEEVAMLSELSHLQEVVDQLDKHTADPHSLPPASEQVITELKNSEVWNFQTPPSSPGSLGSRKSSMCSISSLNSSSSGSSKSHHSPNHHYWHRSLSQHPVKPHGLVNTRGLSSLSSQDSGFTSQDTLFNKNAGLKVSNMCEQSGDSSANTPCGSSSTGPVNNPTATWPNLQETLQFERAASAILNERPHTISTAYERGHQRPALTVYTFHAPEGSLSQPASPVPTDVNGGTTPVSVPQPSTLTTRPPIPHRCSSLERPTVPSSKARPHFPLSQAVYQKTGIELTQPMYVNMHELANLAANKAQELNFPPPPPEITTKEQHSNEKVEISERGDGSTSESSLESSSGYGSQTIQPPIDENNPTCEDVVFSNSPSNSSFLTQRSSGPTIRPRPCSTSGYPSGSIRGALLRRGSMQGHKPPPPIRRTSSISMAVRPPLTPPSSHISGENTNAEALPPPPAFLLENAASEGIKSHVSNDVSPKNISEYQRTAALDIAAELQRKAAQLTIKEKKTTIEVKHQGSSISVAETVRTLTELKHTPASPVSIRRTHSLRSQSADRKVEPGLIAALSAKLAPARRFSQDVPQCAKASRVRQWIAVRTLPDPTLCHESLMEQIKRGTALRKTGTINDRSAPRIH